MTWNRSSFDVKQVSLSGMTLGRFGDRPTHSITVMLSLSAEALAQAGLTWNRSPFDTKQVPLSGMTLGRFGDRPVHTITVMLNFALGISMGDSAFPDVLEVFSQYYQVKQIRERRSRIGVRDDCWNVNKSIPIFDLDQFIKI